MSRDVILAAVRRGKPPERPHPGTHSAPPRPGDPWTWFEAALEAAGGRALRVADESELPERMRAAYPDALHVLSGLDSLEGSGATEATRPHDYAHLDLTVARGELAVAENAAVWVPETSVPEPAALFLAQHLVLVVSADAVVPDMHAAYAELARRGTGRWGCFISGPSKTADIEQCLVIGAHGPRSLLVCVCG